MIRYLFLIHFYVSKHFWIIINRIKFRIMGASIGDNCRAYGKFYLLNKMGGAISIGNNFHLLSGNYFNPLVKGNRTAIYVRQEAILNIGDNTGISSSCIYCLKSITIGNNVQIGANSLIMDSDAHSKDYEVRRNSSDDLGDGKPIRIEDDVLIGTNSIVLKGVTIGARSIIGAGSIVTKNIPADCVAAGNPCKVIRYLKE